MSSPTPRSSVQDSNSGISAEPGLVLLTAEPTKDVHHGAFGRIFEGSQGDVLSLGQQGFGFSHFSSLMDVSK